MHWAKCQAKPYISLCSILFSFYIYYFNLFNMILELLYFGLNPVPSTYLRSKLKESTIESSPWPSNSNPLLVLGSRHFLARSCFWRPATPFPIYGNIAPDAAMVHPLSTFMANHARLYPKLAWIFFSDFFLIPKSQNFSHPKECNLHASHAFHFRWNGHLLLAPKLKNGKHKRASPLFIFWCSK